MNADKNMNNVPTPTKESFCEDSVIATAKTIGMEEEEKTLTGVGMEEEEKTVTESEDVVTLAEIVEDGDYRENTARMLLGGQDGTVCSYPEGYKPRQALYSCLTCTSENEQAGICYGCSIHCHDGHSLVELYTKRKFRCDCGNSKFARKCLLYEDKDALNVNNSYNQNFAGLFCACHKQYPSDDDDTTMIQCNLCEDWFHLPHLNIDVDDTKWKGVHDGDDTLICTSCASQNGFLSFFETSSSTICLKDLSIDGISSGPLCLPGAWRKHICSCSYCENIYERAKCSFLLDEEDDIAQFEETSMERTKNEREPDENTIVNALVKEAGRDTAINVMKGYYDLKTKLGSFFEDKSKDGGVITKEDVNSFFQQMKRRRIDDTLPSSTD